MLGAQLNANFNAAGALAILGDLADTLTATGTNAATAYAIVATTSIFTTVASGTGCILPVCGKADILHVSNLGANPLIIYPPTGGNLSGATSVTLPTSQDVEFVCRGSTTFTVSPIVNGVGTGSVTSVSETLAKDVTETISGVPITSSGTIARTAVDAGADKIVFWDDSADRKDYLAIGSGLSITGTTLSATGGGSGITIGDAVTGGAANAVLFEDASQNIDADGNFTYTVPDGLSLIKVANGSAVTNGAYIETQADDIASMQLAGISLLSRSSFGGTQNLDNIKGISLEAYGALSSNTITELLGIDSYVHTLDAGSITTAIGMRQQVVIDAGANATTAYGNSITIGSSGVSGSISTAIVNYLKVDDISASSGTGVAYGQYIDWVNTVTVATAYGLYISDMSAKASTSYAIKTGTGKVEFGDTVQATGYKSSDGTAGATAGPFTIITSIQVKNGLVTTLTGS